MSPPTLRLPRENRGPCHMRISTLRSLWKGGGLRGMGVFSLLGSWDVGGRW
jgi:hypothetical protein